MLHTTRRPDITFYRRGQIDITARVSKALNIKPGDVIDIACDGEEYYLYVRHRATDIVGRHEAQCWPTSRRVRKCHNMRAYSARLTSVVLGINGNSRTARLPVGEPIELPAIGPALPIIIKYKTP